MSRFGLRRGRLVRDEAGGVVAEAWMADRWWLRLRGLLGRPPLGPGGMQALVIQPCASVHTLGMGYALDLVFLDGTQRVCGWRENVRPWRACGCRGAVATVELPAGAVQRLAPVMHERWRWQPA